MVLDVARRLADDVLFPDATSVDRAPLIGRDRFRPLADAGLFGLVGPEDLGHLDADLPTLRRVIAAIAGGCGARFFMWAQHHGVVRTVRESDNAALRERLLDRLCRGTVMAGVAFAHVRRTDRRAITATRVPGGWHFDGFAPWATSWGIADEFAVAAESADGEMVWGLVEGADSEAVRSAPLELPVFRSTGTVAIRFDRCMIGDDRIVAVDDVDRWRRADRHQSAIGLPAVLGVADRACRLLADLTDDDARRAADRLQAELTDRWQTDDRFVAALLTGSTDERWIQEASAHRSACLDLGQRATTALLAAVGGGGMDLGHDAQRLARESSFYVIQAQTKDGRAATLETASRPRWS